MFHLIDLAKTCRIPKGLDGWGAGAWEIVVTHVVLNGMSSDDSMVEYLRHHVSGYTDASIREAIVAAREALASLHDTLAIHKARAS